MTKYLEKRGSALLVALLVMGVLMTLSLGISALVFGEIRQTSDIVSSGKAYYAAEAGVEQALFALSQGLPGLEADVVYNDSVNDPDLSYHYQINNKGDKIPYFPADQPVFLTADSAVSPSFLYSDLPADTYNVLPLNETVTIPLFTDNGDGTYSDVTDFLVQYYVGFELDDKFSQGVTLQNFDILRWKLFGNPEGGNGLKTDAISDFYPAHDNDRPDNPICIGSSIQLKAANDCITPVAQAYDSNGVGNNLPASWSQARTCYLSEAGIAVAPTDVSKGCSIKTFVDTHKRNYITLTNVVNPEIVGISNIELRASRANIYYRVIALSGEDQPKLPRDAAEIRSDGFARSGTVKQSINSSVGMSSFLPVFNFSLYRTDTTSEKDSPYLKVTVPPLPF
ncbi:hypothetical protein KKG19_04785 [Patescibacteria group bacterium]|nr:hypothetical protein [Patescibacteria group bacterium]